MNTEQIKLEVAKELKTYEPTLANGVITCDMWQIDGKWYEPTFVRPVACAKPCEKRCMMGRSWWKLLGYNFSCGCAWDALEVSLTKKLTPDPQKIDHFFGESVERQKNNKTMNTKMNATKQPITKIEGNITFGISELVYFIRGFFGKENPFADDKLARMAIDEMKEYMRQNADTRTLDIDEWYKEMEYWGPILADLEGDEQMFPTMPMRALDLIFGTCVHILSNWVFYGVYEARLECWKHNVASLIADLFSIPEADKERLEDAVNSNHKVFATVSKIASNVKTSIEHAGFRTESINKIGLGEDLSSVLFKCRDKMRKECGITSWCDVKQQFISVVDTTVSPLSTDEICHYKINFTIAARRHFMCGICNKYCGGYGNNAAPVYEGKCCDDCNDSVIVRRRIMLEEQKKQELKNKEMEMEAQLKREAIEKELLSQGNVKVICEKPKTKKQLQAEATREANNVKKAADKAKKEYENACEISRLARAKSAQDKQKKILKAKRDNQIKCALAYATVPRNF
jgi:hypothetical protein